MIFKIDGMFPAEFAFHTIMQLKNRNVTFINPGSRRFRFGGTSYTPDFYDPIDDLYYEVCSSRYVYNTSKSKIAAFRKAYPNINLKIVKPDGTPIAT